MLQAINFVVVFNLRNAELVHLQKNPGIGHFLTDLFDLECVVLGFERKALEYTLFC